MLFKCIILAVIVPYVGCENDIWSSSNSASRKKFSVQNMHLKCVATV